jgi:predicted ATPase
VERAHLIIQRAEPLGEAPEDPLLLFSFLNPMLAVSVVAFNGDVALELAAQLLALAEKEGTKAHLILGHRAMGIVLLHMGDIGKARSYFDQAIALYDPAVHRPLATRFGQDVRVHATSYRSWANWLLGSPNAALADADRALSDAREIGEAATLMQALAMASFSHVFCGDHAAASAEANELVTLADEKSAPYWRAAGILLQGRILGLTGDVSEAVQMITSGIAAWRSTGTTLLLPFYLSYLATAYAKLSQFDDAWRCIGEAMNLVEKTKETWLEAEVDRMAGEVALLSPDRDPIKTEAYFERALAVARAQQAKSLELRAAMSMARLWRDQGKRDEARELLAPAYGWFTEGFDTLDLKEAKALLEELAA